MQQQQQRQQSLAAIEELEKFIERDLLVTARVNVRHEFLQ